MNSSSAIPDLRSDQFARLRALLDTVHSNPFYRRKYEGIPLGDIRSLNDLLRLPCTTKAELVHDQLEHPLYGSNLAKPLADYVRLHQTSGTSTGKPLRWLDTHDNWAWLVRLWELNFDMMGIGRGDRIAFPFSFGPFLGFWTGFEAAAHLGAMVLPCGGMPTATRLKVIRDHGITVVCCTPTYAMHMAEVAEAEGIDLPGGPVRALVVAGEPGGSLASVRALLEEKWGARVFDHYGLTETGPIANETEDAPCGLFALESEFIIEVIEPNGDSPVVKGTAGELVVTNLGRLDSPLIRYRTGDIVAVGDPPAGAKCDWTYFPGGIRGRVDDMIHIRGNNVYPTAIEDTVRRFQNVAEFRIVVDRSGPLADLSVEVEWLPNASATALEPLERALRDVLQFRAHVVAVPTGSLPRSEMKSRRVCFLPS